MHSNSLFLLIELKNVPNKNKNNFQEKFWKTKGQMKEKENFPKTLFLKQPLQLQPWKYSIAPKFPTTFIGIWNIELAAFRFLELLKS